MILNEVFQEVFLHLSLENLKGFPVRPESLALDNVCSWSTVLLCVLNCSHASKRPSIKKKTCALINVM